MVYKKTTQIISSCFKNRLISYAIMLCLLVAVTSTLILVKLSSYREQQNFYAVSKELNAQIIDHLDELYHIEKKILAHNLFNSPTKVAETLKNDVYDRYINTDKTLRYSEFSWHGFKNDTRVKITAHSIDVDDSVISKNLIQTQRSVFIGHDANRNIGFPHLIIKKNIESDGKFIGSLVAYLNLEELTKKIQFISNAGFHIITSPDHKYLTNNYAPSNKADYINTYYSKDPEQLKFLIVPNKQNNSALFFYISFIATALILILGYWGKKHLINLREASSMLSKYKSQMQNVDKTISSISKLHVEIIQYNLCKYYKIPEIEKITGFSCFETIRIADLFKEVENIYTSFAHSQGIIIYFIPPCNFKTNFTNYVKIKILLCSAMHNFVFCAPPKNTIEVSIIEHNGEKIIQITEDRPSGEQNTKTQMKSLSEINSIIDGSSLKAVSSTAKSYGIKTNNFYSRSCKKFEICCKEIALARNNENVHKLFN